MKADDLNTEVVLAVRVLNLIANKTFLSLHLFSDMWLELMRPIPSRPEQSLEEAEVCVPYIHVYQVRLT